MGLLDREQDLMIVHGAMTRDLEAAEAEAAKWREMHDDRDHDLKHEYARATAADAECERLRALEAKSREYADKLAWQARALLSENGELVRENASQRTEVERLRAARTLLSDVYNAFGYTWPLNFVEDVGAFLANTRQDAH